MREHAPEVRPCLAPVGGAGTSGASTSALAVPFPMVYSACQGVCASVARITAACTTAVSSHATPGRLPPVWYRRSMPQGARGAGQGAQENV
jgi:hypothetical protein